MKYILVTSLFLVFISLAPLYFNSSTSSQQKIYPAFSSYNLEEARKQYLASCSVCHQINGGGLPGVIPPLAESRWVNSNPRIPIRIALNGLQGPITVCGNLFNRRMPSQKQKLDAHRLASILTYIRQSWGNRSPEVSPELVEEEMMAHGKRSKPWNPNELALLLDEK